MRIMSTAKIMNMIRNKTTIQTDRKCLEVDDLVMSVFKPLHLFMFSDRLLEDMG